MANHFNYYSKHRFNEKLFSTKKLLVDSNTNYINLIQHEKIISPPTFHRKATVSWKLWNKIFAIEMELYSKQHVSIYQRFCQRLLNREKKKNKTLFFEFYLQKIKFVFPFNYILFIFILIYVISFSFFAACNLYLNFYLKENVLLLVFFIFLDNNS